MPLIGGEDDWDVAANARGPAIASAIASLRTWIFMETPIRVRGYCPPDAARRMAMRANSTLDCDCSANADRYQLSVGNSRASKGATERYKGLRRAPLNRPLPQGSKPEKLNASKCFPLCPRERTLRNGVGLSVSCHHRKSARRMGRAKRHPSYCKRC